MLLHSCESISTRLEGTTSTSAECDQISIDHRPRALDGGAEVRESDIQASTDSPNRRRRNTARIDSKPANPLLIPSYAAGCVSQKNSPDLGGTPLTLTEVFGWCRTASKYATSDPCVFNEMSYFSTISVVLKYDTVVL